MDEAHAEQQHVRAPLDGEANEEVAKGACKVVAPAQRATPAAAATADSVRVAQLICNIIVKKGWVVGSSCGYLYSTVL